MEAWVPRSLNVHQTIGIESDIPLKTFAFLTLASAVLFAQNRPDARDLLSRADAPIFTAKTVRVAATRSQSFVGSQLPGSPFKIEFVRGGRGCAPVHEELINLEKTPGR